MLSASLPAARCDSPKINGPRLSRAVGVRAERPLIADYRLFGPRRFLLDTLSAVSWNIADRVLVSWLGTPETDLGWCGYSTDSRPDAVWLLHAMYEHESGSAELTYNEERRQRLAAGLETPTIIAGFNLDAASVVIGNELGRSEHLGPGWRR